MTAKPLKKNLIFIMAIAIFFIIGFLLLSFNLKNKLLSVYNDRQSITIKDRNDQNIFVKPNSLGYYAEYSDKIPPRFKKLLLKKEDKYFYYHFGINYISNLRAIYNYLGGKQNLASSTITQQLAKILLGNETKRNFKNKLIETAYAVSLEIHLSKEEILQMYINSVYFGNKVQGLNQASRLYFGVQPELLDDQQILQLLSAISSPSVNNPFTKNNSESFQRLASKFSISYQKSEVPTEREIAQRQEKFKNYLKGDSYFELKPLGIDCASNCRLTIDQNLSGNLREILKRNLLSIGEKSVTNGAIIVIKLPGNELLSIIGSPDPEISSYGYQINMAAKPRPIGSTVKPFIYLKGFEKGLRPYTLVEDKEYKYTIGTGFAFYPKNYDYEYRGMVNLHYALTNSLNVPTVKVLEYVGLDDFYNFLLEDLKFKPIQELENYQLGIALGGLEMDLLSLSYYFTIFPNNGILTPFNVCQNKNSPVCSASANINFPQNKKIADEKYIQLINKILSDRKTGIEQFGMKSNLNLLQDNYAVKTGTSREFHDSWTIGYTPDFLVGVWVGNSDNTPMDEISGQSGAGRIWHEAMNLLINSPYNKKTPFNFDLLKEFYNSGNVEYGLAGDNYENSLNLLENKNLILNPHNQDSFLLEENTQIPLQAREKAKWYIDNKFVGEGKEIIFKPSVYGAYEIRAVAKNGREREEVVEIFIEAPVW